MPLKAILFDLDGTLLDTAPDFIFVLNTLLLEQNCAPLQDSVIRTAVSSGARALIRLAFNLSEDDPQFETLRLRLLELYSQHLADKTTLFPDMDKLLKLCQERNWYWGVVTNKPSRFTDPLLLQLTSDPKPDVVICPDHVVNTKPHPEPIYLACKMLGISPAETIYIGDHPRDIEAGKNAGTKTIAAAYGYLEENQSADDWGADLVVNSVAEILKHLEELDT